MTRRARTGEEENRGRKDAGLSTARSKQVRYWRMRRQPDEEQEKKREREREREREKSACVTCKAIYEEWTALNDWK